jgi:Protein of unknown function (DUF4058)
MPSPFPGMDPYLEARRLWRGLHLQLICNIAADLQPQLVPRYVARLEERVLLAPLDEPLEPDVNIREAERDSRRGVQLLTRPATADAARPEIIEVPDLTIPHRFVEILDPEHHEVITIIEVLSPWNKTGRGRQDYRERQDALLLSEASLVEIDLLRRGPLAIALPEPLVPPSDYRICIHRAGTRRFELIRFGVRDPLPNVGIPLRYDDPDVVLRLGSVLDRCYEAGAYQYIVDYNQPPDPPLAAEDAAWASRLLRGSEPQ